MELEITRELAKILSGVRHYGDFYATDRFPIVMPNMDVDGVGRIAFPLLPVQAEQLIAVAERAPYGRGEETRLDIDVRRTWQIDASHVHLSGPDWSSTLDSIVAQALANLGVEAKVTAEPYKLLIYDTGSFFLEHRDTEKAPGMFASLVVSLPSDSSGGELIVRHKGNEVCLDLSSSDSSTVSFAAFYADCVHEVRPVTSGYRIVLIYNLIRSGRRKLSAPPSYESEQAAIAARLRRWTIDKAKANNTSSDDDLPEKLIYPLEHVYTPAELAFDMLKNADAAAAGVLTRAADEADCEIYLALVSIEESGSAEYYGYYNRRSRGRSRGYRGRYDYDDHDDDDEDDEDDDYDDSSDYEIGEVFDRTLRISEWRRPDGGKPAFSAMSFEENELCPPESFDELDPDEQHFHEATGNAGASFDRIYRQAALVLWPRSRRFAVLNQSGLHASLSYLDELTQDWIQSGKDQESPSWREAHELAEHILRGWPASNSGDHYPFGNNDHAVSMLKSLTQLRDVMLIDAFLTDLSEKWLYRGTENEALARAASLLVPDREASLVERIIAQNAPKRLDYCTDLLLKVAENAKVVIAAGPLLLSCATMLVDALTKPNADAQRVSYSQRLNPVGFDLVVNLLTITERIEAPLLAERVVEHVLSQPSAFDMDIILLPAVLALAGQAQTAGAASTRRLHAACLAHLRNRIAQPLAPPADFARENPIVCRCAHCLDLGRFLVDPKRGDWIFKAAESERSHVESSIRQYHCDVNCETIRTGRPYSLACRKNQASYERRVKQRKEDLQHLEQLESIR